MTQFLVLLLVLVLVVFPLWAILRILALGRQNDAIAQQLAALESQLEQLRDKLAALPPAASREHAAAEPPPAAASISARATTPPTALQPAEPPPVPPGPSIPAMAVGAPAVRLPPVLPPLPRPSMAAASGPLPGQVQAPAAATGTPPRLAVNWEQFMGAKLFAWLGGLAAFLGAVFFIKYSFEHDLIPPSVRAALGYAFGIALVLGGLKINRQRYAITVQTLCATGVVVLYAVTFASNAVYHFAFFGLLTTFLLMSLITAAAFVLAVQLEARVVAVLGLVGGFLTPFLLSTGRDNPAGLFSYAGLLDVGLIAVALHRRWWFLVALGAGGTILMQAAWAARFMGPGKAPTAMLICLAFCALFLAAYIVTRRVLAGRPAPSARARPASLGPSADPVPVPPIMTWSAIAFPLVAFAFALVFIGDASVSGRPGLYFTFILLADGCLLALAWLDEQVPRLHLGAGLAVFALMAAWTAERLRPGLLGWALGFYLLYAVLHSAFPLVLERRRASAAPTWWSQLFPPLTLLLMLGPLLKLDPVPIGLWPGILLVDLLAIGLALLTASVVAVMVVLVLTLGATALWVLRVPPTGSGDAELLVIGGFAVLFFAAGLYLAGRLGDEDSDTRPGAGGFDDPRVQLPAFAALLPFVLLVLMTQRLTLADPSAVFGAALLLVLMTLGLTRALAGNAAARIPTDNVGEADSTRPLSPPFRQASRQARGLMVHEAVGREPVEPAQGPEPAEGPSMRREAAGPTGIEWLPACALVGVVALEFAWQAGSPFNPRPGLALGWHVLFTLVFAAYPFVFRRAFAALTGPWAVAAIAGMLHFLLVYRLVQRAWPNDTMGVLPALFAVPPLLSLAAIVRAPAANPRARLNQLAWFGGAAFFFITLIVPIQFERQWITIGWALEGVALLWLFQRVPHEGLRGTGVVLLLAAFVRLALNPAVLTYHPRSDGPVFNWYLYAYGAVAVCLFTGARRLARGNTDQRSWTSALTAGLSGVAALNALGVILVFLLLNLEIADYFSIPGAQVLTFEFSGNFARDMSYTIGWALFALGLLLAGIWKRTRAGRYAALGLLGVALLKLFLHDLAHLEALYRIGALFAVAVIAIGASVAYQRFRPGDDA